MSNKENNRGEYGNPNRMTAKEQKERAKSFGYTQTNEYIKGQRVFNKGKYYISYDVDSHNGGVWKMAKSIEGLKHKKTRLGTFNANLERIGD